MIGVNASGSQALQLLQTSSPSHLASLARDANPNAPAAYVGLPGTKVDAAISAIMNILLDAQGNANVSIFAPDGFAFAQTGDGDDIISMDVHHTGYVSSGGGNDSISIRTYAASEAVARAYYGEGNRPIAAVHGVSSGDGNDRIAVDSHGHVDNVDAGSGDDTITVKSTSEHNDPSYLIMGGATRIDAGAGNDAITIDAANGMVDVVNGGSGDDTLEISGRYVGRIFGDEGDDTLRLTADRWVSGVWGGDGNDTIEVTAPTIHTINGGKGDDRIILNNTANTYSGITLEPGDGHDYVEANSAVTVHRFVGTNKPYQMSEAAIERIDESTLKITFGDADDSVTIKFTGDMAGKPLAFDFYKSGFVMIRRDDPDAPTLPQVGHAANPVVLTRYA